MFILALRRRDRSEPSPCRRASLRGRAGTSAAELIVAMAVLATAVVGVGRFASTAKQGLRDRELSARIGWELVNAREQIGSWHPQEITVQQIEQLPISDWLRQKLDDAHWSASLTSVSEPAQAVRVTLTLRGTLRNQKSSPASLVFWVESPQASLEVREAANP